MIQTKESEIVGLINYKRHKIAKILDNKQQYKALKVFTFKQTDTEIIMYYKQHFEGIKQWIKMIYFSQSILNTINQIKIDERRDKATRNIYLKVQKNYVDSFDLEAYYTKLRDDPNLKISQSFDTYIYMFEQFLEVILRGGSIPNYFYTPRNLLIIIKREVNQTKYPKLLINIFSTVGLELLYLKNKIIKQDLEEIIPLLPTNLFELKRQDYSKQLNRIIHLKAFGWLVLTFVLQQVPNMINRQKLNVLVSAEQVKQLLKKMPNYFIQLLASRKKKIKKAQHFTFISNLQDIFKKIFVENCDGITWNYIYKEFFKKSNDKNREENKITYNHKTRGQQQETLEKIKYTIKERNRQTSQTILCSLWKMQKHKKYYQQYYQQNINQNVLYLAIKLNISFHRFLSYENIIQLLTKQQEMKQDIPTIQKRLIESFLDNDQKCDNNDHPFNFNQRKKNTNNELTIQTPEKFYQRVMKYQIRQENEVQYIPHRYATIINQFQSHLW